MSKERKYHVYQNVPVPYAEMHKFSKNQGKSKVHPITGREGPEGGQR
jgi:hypothetical protein